MQLAVAYIRVSRPRWGRSGLGLEAQLTELGPDVDPFMLHIHAGVAEKEHNRIAPRTREALAPAKARGQRLSDPEIGKGNRAAAANGQCEAAVRLGKSTLLRKPVGRA